MCEVREIVSVDVLHVHNSMLVYMLEHVSAITVYYFMLLLNFHNLPDSNAMLLPGRVPGYKDTDVKLLPCSTTKNSIWKQYLQAAANSSMRALAYPTFTQLWRQLLPHILVMKPMSDLCWVCQQNSTAITRSANHPEEKSTVSTYTYNAC